MRLKGYNHYVLPKNDEFMTHNVPKARDRLRSISGFTGSSGYLVVNADEA